MLAMHRDGLIVLALPNGRQNRARPIVCGPNTEPPMYPAPTTLDEVRPLTLRPVVRATRDGKRWNEFIARYHYLRIWTLVGAQMCYAVHDRDGLPIAILGFSTAAWKLAPRDRFIGRTPQPREKNLHLVVDNGCVGEVGTRWRWCGDNQDETSLPVPLWCSEGGIRCDEELPVQKVANANSGQALETAGFRNACGGYRRSPPPAP